MRKKSPRKRHRGDCSCQRVSMEKTVRTLSLTSGYTFMAVLRAVLQLEFSFIPVEMTSC